MARLDKGILLAVFTLMGIGLVQIYSSSFMFAIESRGDGLYFFKKQILFTIISLGVLFFSALVPWKWIERWGYLLWALGTFAVLLTFIPGLGAKAGGAGRWIALPGGIVFEPSELIKVSISLVVATLIARDLDFLQKYKWPVRIAVVAIPLALLLKQPDFGSFFICTIVTVGLLFAFGLPWKYIGATIAVALPSFYFLVMNVPYRRARIMAFLDPWADPSQKGFQVIQSMLSFHSGGVTGAGLGESQGKLFFLPEAHTDFTMAIFGEEMGFTGFCFVLMIYGYLVVRGLQLASRTEDIFARAVSLGLSLTFGFSVFINVGVVTGLLPTKGLTLPFLSYGGSSLLMTAFMFGLLLNIQRQENKALPVGRKGERMFRFAQY